MQSKYMICELLPIGLLFSVRRFFANPFRTRISLVELKTMCLYFPLPLRARPNQSVGVHPANQSLGAACFPQQLHAGFIAELHSAALLLATEMQHINHLQCSRELAQHKSN